MAAKALHKTAGPGGGEALGSSPLHLTIQVRLLGLEPAGGQNPEWLFGLIWPNVP